MSVDKGRGTTFYGYAGNEVTEPNPEGGLLETTYTYSDLGQVLTVNMTRGGVTQTQTWAYDADKREKLASVTHPESGKTSFTYNNDGTVAEKTDAKLQKLVKRAPVSGIGERDEERLTPGSVGDFDGGKDVPRD